MNHCRIPSFGWGMILLTGFLLCLAVTGCSTPTRPPDVYQVERHRSAVQTVRLINTHDVDLVIVSRDEKDRQTIEPGQTMDFTFIVVTLTDMLLDEAKPWYVMQDSVIHYVDQMTVPVYLETSGSDVVLNLRPGGNLPDPLRLSLQNCPGGGWGKGPAPAAHHDVRSRSIAGVPTRLCPR